MVKVQQYVCFVALNSQIQPLVRVSGLAVERVSDPAMLFNAGDRMDLRVLEKNQGGSCGYQGGLCHCGLASMSLSLLARCMHDCVHDSYA